MSAREPASETTPLGAKLVARIEREGPISVADYMDACLNDPEHGYYRKSMAIGRWRRLHHSAGNQPGVRRADRALVRGGLAGGWARPDSLRLIELGPGRGTLMRDALRAARADPAFRAALDVQLIESNATLEAMQRASLAGLDVPVGWSEALEPASAPVATIVIANEFLDTLPIAQWVFGDGRWHHRCVGLGDNGELRFVAGAEDLSIAQTPRDGDILESRGQAVAEWAAKLADSGAPLAALFIDYGHPLPTLGDTLQAVSAHRYDDPLRAPGEADLSAQVDFAAVTEAMQSRGLACDGPVAQGQFLSSLGIVERASRAHGRQPGKGRDHRSRRRAAARPIRHGHALLRARREEQRRCAAPGLRAGGHHAQRAVVLRPCCNRSKQAVLPASPASATGSSRVWAVSQMASMRASTAGRARRMMLRTLQRTAPASRTIWVRQETTLSRSIRCTAPLPFASKGQWPRKGAPKPTPS